MMRLLTLPFRLLLMPVRLARFLGPARLLVVGTALYLYRRQASAPPLTRPSTSTATGGADVDEPAPAWVGRA
jgi:hypothetical protein